ncbi:HAD superfamily hydrolase (TIGR01549 family) [Pseudomonas sp. IAP-CY TE4608]
MPIVAAVFDAFGTVVHIQRKRHPFRRLLRIGAQQGRKPSAGDLHHLMTSGLGIEDAARFFGITLCHEQMKSLQHDLDVELESITVYPDAIEALRLLKARGIATGICSNLALPYGPVLRRLLNDVDGFALSYELGMMKPHEGIYRDICRQLGVRPELGMNPSDNRVVMVGDSLQCDQNGPRAFGISGYFLDRTGTGSLSNLARFAELVIEDKLPALRQ